MSRDALVPPVDPADNETFRLMATAFQAERSGRTAGNKKKNNIWGSIIQEDTLNSSLSGFGVNR